MAWHFCSKANTHKMEKVQERALRFIYEDYDSTYDQLLLKAKTPSLEIKRLRSMAIECFKIIHDLSPPCLSDLVSYKNSSYNFRYSNLLEIPHVRTTTYGKKSFQYAAPILWNQLPENFRSQTLFYILGFLYLTGLAKNVSAMFVLVIDTFCYLYWCSLHCILLVLCHTSLLVFFALCFNIHVMYI